MRILIAGGGQVGTLTARRLSREGHEIVVIEPDAERCARLEAELDIKVVRGSAVRILTMREARMADADLLIAVTSSDEVNFLACLIAQVEAKVPFKVARIRTHEVDHWRRLAASAGIKIDLVIHPESDLAARIMRVVRVPGVSDILDFAEGRVKLFGMNIEPKSWLAGKSLEELQRAGPPSDSLIALVFRGSEVIIPHGTEVLRPGDHIYTIGTRDNLPELLRFMGLEAREKLDRVFVVGGKQIGIRVAEELERQGVAAKLFERDAARAAKIAGLLSRTVVIHGDGTDQATLQEAGIEGVDAFLALTGRDEDNIIACLLARRLGAPKVAALINRLDYLAMAQRIGVNATISPRLAAVDRILQFVRKGGRVVSVHTFREEEAEAIELIAAEGSKYVGKHLREIRFPGGAIVGALVRPSGEVRVPRGDVRIEAGDRVIFFTLERNVRELESAFLASGRVFG
jgi:trk system potassium uptake protein TrkA